jgi:release factor glutamine methyltransferase
MQKEMRMDQTVLAVLARARDLLKTHSIDSPRLDAELLLAHVLGISRLDLVIQRDRNVSEQELEAFERLLERRLTREPVAYLLGEKEFYGRSFRVSPHVLIPRPETEIIVDQGLILAPANARVLEIGVGSGAVILSLLCERSDLVGFGTDISVEAVRLTKENAMIHGVSLRLHLYAGDLFHGLESTFPLILINPPYVALSEQEALEDDVALFEPGRALFGGKDGLDIVKEIIETVPGHLSPGGICIMEVGKGQKKAVEDMVSRQKAIRLGHWVDDLTGVPRTVIIERVHG